MALISCDECGRQVSNLAKTCPGCGAPVVTGARLANEIEAPRRRGKPGARLLASKSDSRSNTERDESTDQNNFTVRTETQDLPIGQFAARGIAILLCHTAVFTIQSESLAQAFIEGLIWMTVASVVYGIGYVIFRLFGTKSPFPRKKLTEVWIAALGLAVVGALLNARVEQIRNGG